MKSPKKSPITALKNSGHLPQFRPPYFSAKSSITTGTKRIRIPRSTKPVNPTTNIRRRQPHAPPQYPAAAPNSGHIHRRKVGRHHPPDWVQTGPIYKTPLIPCQKTAGKRLYRRSKIRPPPSIPVTMFADEKSFPNGTNRLRRSRSTKSL